MSRAVRLTSTTAIGAAVIATVTLALALGTATAQEANDAGQEVYLANCASCHQPNGLGVPGAFPPLSGNPHVQDTAHVEDVIHNGLSGPIEVLGETYDGVMPSFSSLSDGEIEAVIAYVQADNFEAGGTEELGPGDAATGKAIFLGSQRLENAGPACVACHTAAEYHGLNGSTLGPDLTDLAVRYGGEDAVAAALANPPSVTMQPLFDSAPMTDQERADLGAYFGSIADEQPGSGGIDIMLAGGLVMVAIFFALMLLAPRSRRRGFADQLRSQR